MTPANRAMLYSTAIHEAGHAVVMERVGIGVREIRLDGDCDDPRGGTDALNSDEDSPRSIASRLSSRASKRKEFLDA